MKVLAPLLSLMILILGNTALAGTPLHWLDLDSRIGDENLKLRQKISFDEGFSITQGERFRLLSNSDLSVPVYYYELQAVNCPNPESRAEMILVLPDPETPGARQDSSVGVRMMPGCILEIFVDHADYQSVSLFQD